MSQLLDELYELSDNTVLFEALRKGGDPLTLAPLPSVAKGRKSKLLARIRDAIIPALRANDVASLHALIGDSDTTGRVAILGELILTLHALAEGKHTGDSVVVIQKVVFRLALDLVSALESNPPQDADDEELLTHSIAMREWAHVLSGYFKAEREAGHATELLMIRARVTNSTLSGWPNLVGAAMVEIALALEPLGNLDMAKQCYEGVRLDLRYLIQRHQSYPSFQAGCALYWLQRACEARLRLVPDDKDAQADLEGARKVRQERGDPDAISAPRFGPIARTYLDRIPYLACIIRDMENCGSPEECVATICERYGCVPNEVEFYMSAHGSYHQVRQILAGVNLMYDDAHKEVFAAIEYLAEQKKTVK